jgi:hypothetical protein
LTPPGGMAFLLLPIFIKSMTHILLNNTHELSEVINKIAVYTSYRYPFYKNFQVYTLIKMRRTLENSYD